MTSWTRLLALFTLIGLSMWLGFLLGGNFNQGRYQVPPVTVSQPETNTGTQLETPPALNTQERTFQGQTNLNADERAANLASRIDLLAAQTDDRAISGQRLRLLRDLQLELKSPEAARFADTISYYNRVIPRDATGLLLESTYYRRAGLPREAIETLLAAAEFPESNEQLRDIQLLQAEIFGMLFEEHAAIEDWLGLTDYYESLLLRAPNNDRVRLFLAKAQASSGDSDLALKTLAITGTEAGVSQQEINDLRASLLVATAEPIRFRTEGSSLVANATLNSSPIELLVDTGATKTALATNVLQRLGARPLNRTAEVLTAGGQITAQLYEVPELIVEQTLFVDSIVLALDNPPANWDGLLGMDLLRGMNVDLSDQLDTPP